MESTGGNETIVMTATFSAPATPTLVVRDEDERIHQYLCAMLSWARPRHVRRLVFGENSNTAFDFSKVVGRLERVGKEVEVLVFDGNQEAPLLGKGYGEGKILEYLYKNSRLLNAAPAFYKVTGRLFVSNFDLVSEATPGLNAFRFKRWKDGRRPKIIMRCFKCSRQLFESRLIDAYKGADDRTGVQIEHVYFDRLNGLPIPDFGVKPAMVGQSASTGEMLEPYDDAIIREARSLM